MINPHNAPQAPGIGVAEYGAALPGRRSERLPGLEPGLDQSLNFPGEVTRTDRTAAEVAASRYRDTGMESDPDAVLGHLQPLGDR